MDLYTTCFSKGCFLQIQFSLYENLVWSSTLYGEYKNGHIGSAHTIANTRMLFAHVENQFINYILDTYVLVPSMYSITLSN